MILIAMETLKDKNSSHSLELLKEKIKLKQIKFQFEVK